MRRTREGIKTHQKKNASIVDWWLAIDFDVGQTHGEPKQ
jgi:hypothetical protein